MKKNLLFSVGTLLFSCLTLIVHSQEITLSQTNESGIYGKGQKISVKAFAEDLAGDTLYVKVFKNNTQLIDQKNILAGKDSMVIFEGSYDKPCSIIVEAKAGGKSTSLGMLVDPGTLKPGVRRPGDFERFGPARKRV